MTTRAGAAGGHMAWAAGSAGDQGASASGGSGAVAPHGGSVAGDAAGTDASGLFDVLPEVDEEAQVRLRQRLALAAGAANILDVGYRILDSPLGALLVAATDRGLVRVAYAREDHERVLEQIGHRISLRVLRAPARLDGVAREMGEYFSGARTAFDLPLDLQLSAGFRRTVLTQLTAIPYGSTASYAALAVAAGNPRAVRAAGTACATNPLPIVVPCHRVVRSDGSIGQYVGGTEAKRALLTLESSRVDGASVAG